MAVPMQDQLVVLASRVVLGPLVRGVLFSGKRIFVDEI
jgi:hypothetical protein